MPKILDRFVNEFVAYAIATKQLQKYGKFKPGT